MLKKHQIFLFVLFIINTFSTIAVSQIEEQGIRIEAYDSMSDSLDVIQQYDTIPPLVIEDTISVDTLQVIEDTIPTQANTDLTYFDEEISYTASDSIVFEGSGLAFLYGDADIKYKTTELRADFIRLNMDSSLAYAIGTPDSAGVMQGNPEYVDGNQSYVSKELTYNFKTKKGFIKNVVTEQGEGYVTGEQTKKMPDNSFCMKRGKWTTCENHDHPHFYIQMSKAKVRPGKNIVTGPAHLVMEDVSLPLLIPFGYFPFNTSYSSGFLMPTYGEESNRGFYLRNGGYYFAFNDYLDMAVRGDIYSKGSWGLKAATNYKLRYKYSGNFSMNYMVNQYGEKVLPDFRKSKDYSVIWSHRQDPKSSPYSTFSASVNFSSSSYERNDMMSQYNPSRLSNNQKSSSISYSKRFPESPFSLSASTRASINSSDSTLSLTLPSLNWSMSRVYPFKRKNAIGKAKWYEKVGLTYSGVMSNSIAGKEDEVWKSDLVKDWRNGVRHSIPLGTSFKVMKHFSLNPSVSYTERWYTRHINRSWDQAAYENNQEGIVADTTYGFHRVWDYSSSLSLTTKMYGYYRPWRKLFGDKVDVIRHVMTPSVSFSVRPDFGQEKYGYYETIKRRNANTGDWEDYTYSHFEGALYSTPGRGKSGSLNLSLSNNVEMKVRNSRDTTSDFKKIKLIESLSIGASHNIAADSLRWSNISVRGRTKLFKNFSINFGASFDPYVLDTVPTRTAPVNINKYEWDVNKRIGRLVTASTSFGYSINNSTFSKKKKKKESTDNIENNEPGVDDYSVESNAPGADKEEKEEKKTKSDKYDENGYLKFHIPWNLSFSYSMRLREDMKKFDVEKMAYKYKATQNLRINGGVSFTEKWDLGFSTGYDFDAKEFTSTSGNITRNLHCWSMSVNFVPFGRYKSYNFSIRVNSSMLADLKYDKRSSPSDNPGW